MAERKALAALAPEQELAVDVLAVAVFKLPIAAAQELVRRVGDWLLNEAEIATVSRTAAAERTRRFQSAIKRVAAELGHPPLSTDYLAAYKARGEHDMPSLSTIVKHFGSWPHALLACGYGGVTLPSRIDRRRNYKPKRIAMYPRGRLIECLVACANELERIPTIRDYRIWQEEAVKRARATGYPNDIPAWRTLCDRFGGWPKALEAAGLSTATEDKTGHWEFSPVGAEDPHGKTAPALGELVHGHPHVAGQRIESPGESEIPVGARDRVADQAAPDGGAGDHPRARERGVRNQGQGRLRAVPRVTQEPVRRGA